MDVEWDEAKAESNLHKHNVTFGEAATVFNNPLAVTFFDPDHSDNEERYLTIGESAKGRVLIVSHTDRGRTIRIISARQATRAERRKHEDGNYE